MSATACGASRRCAASAASVSRLRGDPVAASGSGPRARAPARGSLFAIHGAVLDGVDTTFDLPGWGLTVAHVHAHGNLALASTPGAGGPDAHGRPARASVSFTFDVSDADLGGGGVLRILDGPARVELPFSAGRIERLATTSDAPDDLRLDADGVATGASRLSVHGAFTGIYGVSRPRRQPGIDLHAHLEHAADAVRAILARRTPPLPVTVGAGDADFQLSFAGPFNDIPRAGQSRRRRAASTSAGARSRFAASASMPRSSRQPPARASRASPSPRPAAVGSRSTRSSTTSWCAVRSRPITS